MGQKIMAISKINNFFSIKMDYQSNKLKAFRLTSIDNNDQLFHKFDNYEKSNLKLEMDLNN